MEVAVCAIAKNENLYIREWVEWYKNLGISKIFLYDNNDLDGERFEEVINDYIESDFVEVIDIREQDINKSICYIDFYEGEGNLYDWICFFDIDEFLTFNSKDNLYNFLSQDKFKDIDKISVSLKDNKEIIRYIIKTNHNNVFSQNELSAQNNTLYPILSYSNNFEASNDLKVAVCAIAKNENLYIREWVEWYKNLEISKIFLYDNNDINGERFEDVINDYVESGFVEIRNCRGKTKYQLNTYIEFYNNDSINYDWVCFFDIDEFLVLNKDNNINSYLSRNIFNEYETIAINWKNYGDSDLLGNENNFDRSCLKRFTKEIEYKGEKYSNEIFKKIIRGGLRKITKIESPHTFSPSLDKKTCNNIGQLINSKKFKCEINFELAYLKHFCTKTILEFILKAKRGGGVNGLTIQYSNLDNFFKYNKRTKEKENIIKKAYSNNNEINLCVVNYNTPELIDYLIRSIKLHVKSNWHLYIFDNSDKTNCISYNEDNITIFDNTKGQIINFDIWLEQFPERLECWAKHNGWASAKHCYSVEKCFDLINDNFILLDSDILIKKDISELYRNDLFYVGEIQTLKTQKLPRISPFICFINVNLCKLYNIHYFYSKYMHGLSKNANNYDTGGAFYKFVNKYQHLNITFNDYITHFGQGSWQETAKKTILKKTTTIDDWLKEYNYLYDETVVLRKNILEFAKKHYSDLNLNLDNPITIQDKINWLKIYDNNELKSKCTDKILLHNYSEQIFGKDICIPILYTYNTPEEINWNILPNKFIIKCNHGSGMNIIVKNKETINIEEISIKLNKWLNKDFSISWGYEPQYKNIKHKILIEPYMSDNVQTDFLYDYKFWCFNGIPKFFTINGDGGHNNSVNINYYNMDKKPMYISRKNVYKADYNRQYKFPNNFNLMVDYAKKLSENFIFVRVDLYEINNTIYLGELTFTPASGFLTHTNKKYDKIIGDMLTLPIINKN